MASACADQTARVWDITSGQEILRLYHNMERKGPVDAVAFSPNGQYLATGTNDFNAHVWELSTAAEVFRMRHEEAVNSVAFSPNNQYLVTGSGNRAGKQLSEIAKGRGTVWDISDKKEVIQVKLDNAVEGVAFAPDGKSFATASWENTARIWEISTGREVMRVNHPAGYVKAVDFSRDCRYLATGSADKTARIWNLETHQEITRITLYSEVSSVNFSSNGNYLATASLDHSVSIWEPASQHEITRLPATEFQLDAANSSMVAILLNNIKSEINNPSWDSIIGRRIDGISSKYIESKSMLSPDGKFFYGLTCDQQTLNLVRTSEMEKSMSLHHPARVEKFAFNLTEELIATASSDGRVRVWELATGREIQHFSGNENVINISFNADNKLLATGGNDRVVRVWIISTGQEIRALHQEGEPSIIAFSPNGQHIAAANGREEARIWNISSDKPYVAAQIYYEKSLKAINFSPAGKYLLTINGDPSSFDDDTAHFWLWNPEDLIDEACARLTRTLKQEEWSQYLPHENPRKTCTNLIEP